MSTPHPLILAGWIVADLTATVEVIATVLLLAGAIGLGIAMFVWARRWRQRLDDTPTIEAQIESYRNMLDQGLIDSQEFARIQARLEGRSEDTATGIRPGLPPRPTDVRPGHPPPSDSAP